MNLNCDAYQQLKEIVYRNADQFYLRKCLLRFKVLEMSHKHNHPPVMTLQVKIPLTFS